MRARRALICVEMMLGANLVRLDVIADLAHRFNALLTVYEFGANSQVKNSSFYEKSDIFQGLRGVLVDSRLCPVSSHSPCQIRTKLKKLLSHDGPVTV